MTENAFEHYVKLFMEKYKKLGYLALPESEARKLCFSHFSSLDDEPVKRETMEKIVGNIPQ